MLTNELEQALGKLERVQLGTFPTPLHRLMGTEKKLGYAGLYIKRDDMTGLGPGGNKVRSLEYLLGEAVHNGADTVLASGPLQSNLCTLAAAACARLGLRCELVHNGDKPKHPEGNVLLNTLLGAQAHCIGEKTGAQERGVFVEQRYHALRAEGRRPYIIQNGATSGMGAMGYVNAALELLCQCRTQGAGIKTVFAPGGNGGVAAGLVYGNALLGQPFRIIIISVEDDAATLAEHVESTISQAQAILGLPFDIKLTDACEIVDAYRGGGWGENTRESEREVQDFPKDEGIFIENVYNSKVLVGMKDYVRKGLVQGDVCYLHTGGFGSLFSQFPGN